MTPPDLVARRWAQYIAGVRRLTSRAALTHLPAVLVPAVVTLLVLFLKLPETAWPAYGSIYLCAVALVAVTLGWKDAVVSLVIGALLLDYFFVGPVNSLSLPSTDDWAVFLSFVLSSILVAVAIEWRRASEKRLRIGLRLAQAQMDLAEARVLAGLRETQVGVGSGGAAFETDEGQRRIPAVLKQLADSLERNGTALELLSASAPDEAAALRAEAATVMDVATSVASMGERLALVEPAADVDPLVRPQ